MRERYFWVVLGLIGVSLLINTIYAESKQLGRPIFLDHYIETALGDNRAITFYYLTDKNDESQVSYVRFHSGLEGYVQRDFFYEDTSIYNIDTYRHHVLRSVSIDLQNHALNLNTDVLHTDMIVYFSDGRHFTVPIGEFIIHPEGYFSQGESILEGRSGGNSNDGSSWNSFLASEPLKIESISLPFNTPIADSFLFTITGEKHKQSLDALQFPIQLEKDKAMTFRVDLKDDDFTNPFSFAIRISGKTEQGKSFTDYAHYHLFPYLSQDDVNRIIEEKTRGDSGG